MRDKELTLEITGHCDVGCPWCSSSATPEGSHRPLDSIIADLDGYSGECAAVRLSGGEPTEHPAWKEIARQAKVQGYRVVLLTNGLAWLKTLCPFVDQYIVHVVAPRSAFTAKMLQREGCEVGLHAVLTEGNEHNLDAAWHLMRWDRIPLHLLVLQNQGRGVECQPYPNLSWTGQHGCSRESKVTVAWDGTVTSCSALKYGTCVLEPTDQSEGQG